MRHPSPVAQTAKNRVQCGRSGFDPWVRKTPWRRAWLPTPVFLPGESHGRRSWWASVQSIGHDWVTHTHPWALTKIKVNSLRLIWLLSDWAGFCTHQHFSASPPQLYSSLSQNCTVKLNTRNKTWDIYVACLVWGLQKARHTRWYCRWCLLSIVLRTVDASFSQQPHRIGPIYYCSFQETWALLCGWFSHRPFDRCGNLVLPDSTIRKEISELSQSFEAQNCVLACDTVESSVILSREDSAIASPSSHNKVTRMRTHIHKDFVICGRLVWGLEYNYPFRTW